MQTTSSTILRVPDYFPRTSKKCLSSSTPFFTCLSEDSLKPENLNNADAATNSLLVCKKQMEVYEKCMNNDKNKKLPSEYRVSLLYYTLIKLIIRLLYAFVHTLYYTSILLY